MLLFKTSSAHEMHSKSNFNSPSSEKNSVAAIEKSSTGPGTTAPGIGILSAKGGAGASTVALNLTLAFASSGKRTTLIDANLQQPDLVVFLGKQAEHCMSKFFSRAKDYDEAVFDACSLRLENSSNSAASFLMSGAADGSSATEYDLTQLSENLQSLKKQNDLLVFDLPKNLDRHLVTLLDKLDCIVLVFEPTLVSVAAARRWLRIFSELSYPQSKYKLLLNRAGARAKDIEKDLAELLGEDVARVPNAFRFIEDCANEGQAAMLKNPRDKYSIAIAELAKQLSQLPAVRGI